MRRIHMIIPDTEDAELLEDVRRGWGDDKTHIVRGALKVNRTLRTMLDEGTTFIMVRPDGSKVAVDFLFLV